MMKPEVIIAGAALAGSMLVSAVGLGWYVRGWISDVKDLLLKAERYSEKRHRQNLERFRWIAVGMAKLGYTNGQMPTFDD